jgi:hypothetical protein
VEVTNVKEGSAAHHGDLRKGDHIVVWGGVNVRDDVQLDCLVAKSLVKATVVDVDVLRRNTKTSKQIIYFSIDIKVNCNPSKWGLKVDYPMPASPPKPPRAVVEPYHSHVEGADERTQEATLAIEGYLAGAISHGTLERRLADVDYDLVEVENPQDAFPEYLLNDGDSVQPRASMTAAQKDVLCQQMNK